MAADRLVGATLLNQRYRLLSELGQGGMARVYKAQDTRLGRTVAIKILREQYSGDRSFLLRFQEEARAVAALSHPNIVGVYDVGQDDGTYYIVMEHVEGVTLKELIEKQGALAVDVAIRLADQICAGLNFAHGKGIVHRDVKPQNVLVTSDLHAKITDFGIARALNAPTVEKANEVFGTVHYISPEQAQGHAATPASDIYSMGVMLYEMLAGRLPFPGNSPAAVATKHLREQPRPLYEIQPRVPPTLSDIVLQAMAKDPQDRFSSAARLGETLRGYIDFVEGRTGLIRQGKLVSTEKATLDSSVRPQRRRGMDWLLIIFGLITLILILGLGTLGAAVWQVYSVTPTPAPTPAPVLYVPNVVGMEWSMARRFVEMQNLTYRESGRQFSDTVPLDQIIAQSPDAKTPIQPGGLLSVFVSKGPSHLKVPAFKGVSSDDAIAQLKKMGLDVQREDSYDDRVPAGFVFDQLPAAGASVAAGGSVMLKVSKGPTPTATPVPRPTTVPAPSPSAPASPSPSGSSGNLVTVPQVVGKPEQEAKDELQRAGLRLWPYGTNYQGHADLPDDALKTVCVGCVLSTNPTAGMKVAPATIVQIAVRKD